MPLARLSRLLAALLLFLLSSWAAAGTLTVDVLDVGQGDAILLRSPEGKAILIDAGDGHADVAAMLRARGVESLDLVVATHAHADHIGGMAHVLESMPVRYFMDGGVPTTTQTYEHLMEVVEQRGIPYLQARAGRRISFGNEASLEVLWPTEHLLRNTRSDLNANSVVLRLEHQGHCFLFTGDAEAVTEERLVARGLQPCEVLKVPHHGSNHSSTDRFLSALQPRYALISVGEGNRYGHPGQETLRRLAQHGAMIYRTDLSGSIRVISDAGVLEVLEGYDPPLGDTAQSTAAPPDDAE